AAVHRGIIAGIAGHRKEGSYTRFVLSGEYDRDNGDHLRRRPITSVYTGYGRRWSHSGRCITKPRDGPQTRDQESSIAIVQVSARKKKPVRVLRGYKSHPTFAPTKSYRYDGLYEVEKAWMDVGRAGTKSASFFSHIIAHTATSRTSLRSLVGIPH
ncbi:SRA-YDG, partial [Daedaleopsis nitida]